MEFLGMDKKFIMLMVVNGIVVALLVAINVVYLRDVVNLFMPINFLAIAIFSMPLVIVRYTKYKKIKDLEDNFPVFLRDFVESVRGGMTVPRAFESLSRNDYRSLSPYVAKIAVQLQWGIPVERVLLNFSKQTKSRLIGRIISSVVESHKYGGNLADTFEALSGTAVEVDRLKSERSLYLQSQMITGYIIFFVFLGVMLGLDQFLVPSLTQDIPLGLSQAKPAGNLALEYKEIFRNLIIMQGLFAGISVGKMAEGAMIAGLKHSLFMMFVGGLVFTLFG